MQAAHTFDRKPVLGVSLELSCKTWRLALADERRPRPATATAATPQPKDRLAEVLKRIEHIKVKWRLPADCEVVVIYEAGQDGFWIQRALEAAGIRVLVVDAASIPVARQARRAKTDRLDALMLLETLWNWLQGRRGRIRIVHAPKAEAEAQRQLPRDRGELQKEVGQHRDRMRKLLRTAGCWQDLKVDVARKLAAGEFRTWDGQLICR